MVYQQQGSVRSKDPIVEAAAVMFLRDGWVDVRALAHTVGLGRATLYRRYADRDCILGEAIWSIIDAGIPRLCRRIDATGGEFVAEFVRRGLHSSAALPAMRRFVSEHPDVAVRVMTSREGAIHQRLVAAFAQMITDHIGDPSDIDVRDLAYAVVRIAESFYYREILAGNSLDIDVAAAIIGRVLS